MGIKSTTTLHRSDAFVKLWELLDMGDLADLSNELLGDLIDKLHDGKCAREGTTSFDNFLVVDDEMCIGCGAYIGVPSVKMCAACSEYDRTP